MRNHKGKSRKSGKKAALLELKGGPRTVPEVRRLISQLEKFVERNRARTSPTRARQKGLDYERGIAQRFRQLGFLKAKRHLEFQIAEAADGVDIHHVGPFRPQCKNYRRYVNPSVINEVTDDSGFRLLFAKAHAEPSLVTMDEDTFFMLAHAWLCSLPADVQERHAWTDPSQIEI